MKNRTVMIIDSGAGRVRLEMTGRPLGRLEVEVDVSLLKTDAWDGPPYFFGVYEMGDVAMRMWGVDVWERWGLSLLLNREEMVDTEAVEPIVREV